MNVAAVAALDSFCYRNPTKQVARLAELLHAPPTALRLERRYNWPRICVSGGLALLLATLLNLKGQRALRDLVAVALAVLTTKILVVNSGTLPPPTAFQAVFAETRRTVYAGWDDCSNRT